MKSQRCPWCGTDPLYVAYHDEEWGVPSRDETHLFEMLTLEGAQAGLSWITILRKREGYRRAFAEFDVVRVAKFDESKVGELMQDSAIVRNRLKIESTIKNARAVLALPAAGESFAELLWSFVGGKPIQNKWRALGEGPAKTTESTAMSKGLLRRGFRFVGPTVCYSLMQATGMVNDHLANCPRHRAVRALA